MFECGVSLSALHVSELNFVDWFVQGGVDCFFTRMLAQSGNDAFVGVADFVATARFFFSVFAESAENLKFREPVCVSWIFVFINFSAPFFFRCFCVIVSGT